MVDFFLLGALKAGTTTLEALLSTHPKLYTGQVKEPRFFELHYDRGISYLENLMSDGRPGQLRGDCSPQYLHCPWVPTRLRTHFPKAKFLVVLREPAERAYSHWWMRYSSGAEKRSFEECVERWLEQELDIGSILAGPDAEKLWKDYVFSRDSRVTPYVFYFDIGKYASHIKRYYEIFSAEQMLVLGFGELVLYPKAALQKVASFLDLAPDGFEPDFIPRNQGLGPTSVKVKKVAEKLGLSRVVPMTLQDGVRKLFRRLGDRPPKFSPVMREQLRKAYEPHNRELEQLLGYLPWESS